MKEELCAFLRNPIYDNLFWLKVSSVLNKPAVNLIGDKSFSNAFCYLKGYVESAYDSLNYKSWIDWAFFSYMYERLEHKRYHSNYYSMFLLENTDEEAFDLFASAVNDFIDHYSLKDYLENPPAITLVNVGPMLVQLPKGWTFKKEGNNVYFFNEDGIERLIIVTDLLKGIITGSCREKSIARIDYALSAINSFAREKGLRFDYPWKEDFEYPKAYDGMYKIIFNCGYDRNNQFIRVYSIVHNETHVLGYYIGEKNAKDMLMSDMIISGMQLYPVDAGLLL